MSERHIRAPVRCVVVELWSNVAVVQRLGGSRTFHIPTGIIPRIVSVGDSVVIGVRVTEKNERTRERVKRSVRKSARKHASSR